MKTNRHYESYERDWLIENYPKLGIEETTRQFNEKFGRNKGTETIRKYCTSILNVRFKKPKKEDTICWECKNAIYGCSWSRNFKPVEGWDARPTKVKGNPGGVDSFVVRSCPKFERG